MSETAWRDCPAHHNYACTSLKCADGCVDVMRRTLNERIAEVERLCADVARETARADLWAAQNEVLERALGNLLDALTTPYSQQDKRINDAVVNAMLVFPKKRP